MLRSRAWHRCTRTSISGTQCKEHFKNRQTFWHTEHRENDASWITASWEKSSEVCSFFAVLFFLIEIQHQFFNMHPLKWLPHACLKIYLCKNNILPLANKYTMRKQNIYTVGLTRPRRFVVLFVCVFFLNPSMFLPLMRKQMKCWCCETSTSTIGSATPSNSFSSTVFLRARKSYL